MGEGAVMAAGETFRWDILVPAHRYVFALTAEGLAEFNEPGDSSADRFRRYQALKPTHPVHGMIAWPNTLLLRGPVTAVVDPGILMQGPPLLLALQGQGLHPGQVDLVINTHAHADHTQANELFPQARLVLHRLEADSFGVAPLRGGPAPLLLEGEGGEIAPGLRYQRTPGHTDGSVSLLVDTDEGLAVLAGDTVGPLPEYFETMDLPSGFPGREQLLESWRWMRQLRPRVVIPGHNPPLRLDGGGE